jgi:thiamine-monophosphate kinase
VPDATAGQIGEAGLIAAVTARLQGSPPVPVGPGDDAAVVLAPDGRVVATTDVLVEGVHFRRDWSTAYDVGRKAAAANLADVVAMGARPTALLVGLATPGDLPVEWAEQLADGLRDEAGLLGATVVGGDVVASDTLTIAVTALGDLEGRAPLTRSGAQPGDQVVLIGEPGRAAAGLAQLEAGNLDHPLADAHRRPQPPYEGALSLARGGRATAMIDISDGLYADLGHIAVASGVRIDLDPAAIPVPDGLPDGGARMAWMLTGGDDHCFAATVPGGEPGLPTIGTVSAVGAGERPEVTVPHDVFTTPAQYDQLRASGGFDHFRS